MIVRWDTGIDQKEKRGKKKTTPGLTMKCASDDTMVNLGWVLNFAAVLLSVGRSSKARRKVEITFTVMVHSYPSASVPSGATIATDAFSTTASKRSSLSARWQNSRTLAKLPRSSGHTSTTPPPPLPLRPVEHSMSALAFSPRSLLRHARITLAALRRTKWRAASRPRPTLPPVTIMVWPVKSSWGYGTRRNWL